MQDTDASKIPAAEEVFKQPCNMQEVEVLQRVASFTNSEKAHHENYHFKSQTLSSQGHISVDLLDTRQLVTISTPPPPTPPRKKTQHSLDFEHLDKSPTEVVLAEIEQQLENEPKNTEFLNSISRKNNTDIYTPHAEKVQISREELAEQLAKIVHKQNCSSVITSIFRVFLAAVNFVLLLAGVCLMIVGVWGAIDQRFDGVTVCFNQIINFKLHNTLQSRNFRHFGPFIAVFR